MKYLISLSLKYIRRQKLRSLLTFLCITLSIFILACFSAAVSSTLVTLKNSEIEAFGSWEANVTRLLDEADNKSEMIEKIKNHPVVSDYFLNGRTSLCSNEPTDDYPYLTYNEVSFSNGVSFRCRDISSSYCSGNAELSFDTFYFTERYSFTHDNGAYVPESFKDAGLNIGDTVTVEITPSIGKYDMDDPVIKAKIEEMRQANLNGTGNYRLFGCDALDDAPAVNTDLHSDVKALSGFLYDDGVEFSDVALKDCKHGTSCSYTFVVEGFFEVTPQFQSLEFITNSTDTLNFSKQIHENAELLNYTMIPEAYEYSDMSIRINEQLDFDDALMELYSDLGFDSRDFYLYFSEDEEGSLNGELLALELRGNSYFGALMPYIALLLVVLLVLWAVARFVIDNAFEISVQERSRQFAALRIIGASRQQLLALILSEAVFYCITALPIGFIAANLLFSSAFNALHDIGLSYFEFSINPVITIIAALLCIVGIFISAYTSAMYASRKLTPAEALNYGKPKQSKKAAGKAKDSSKLRLSSRSFIQRYTFKNILRTKKRFVVSSIALTLGVLMFSFCLMIGISVFHSYKRETNAFCNEYSNSDFTVYIMNEDLSVAADVFSDEKGFSTAALKCYTSAYSISPSGLQNADKLIPYKASDENFRTFNFINRKEYEEYIKPYSGISYDKLLETNSALIPVCPYGDPVYVNPNKQLYEKGFTSFTGYGFKKAPDVSFSNGKKEVSFRVIGTICSDRYISGLIIPIESLKELSGHFTDLFDCGGAYANISSPDMIQTAKDAVNSSFQNPMLMNDYYLNSGLKTLVSALIKVAVILLLSIWLTGALSMMNSINTSVLNRQNELLMMRSVGMSVKQLISTVITESLLFSSVSTFIGIILSVASFALANKLVLGFTLTEFIPIIIISLVITLIINLLFAVIAALPGIKTLSRNIRQNIM